MGAPSERRGNFYPRPPRGGRRVGGDVDIGHRAISTHALREEGDTINKQVYSILYSFLPTPSARRATDLGYSDAPDVLFLPTPSARRATGVIVAEIPTR